MILTHPQARSRFKCRPAQEKWDKLAEDGYHAQHLRQGGIVFGNSQQGNVGHINWHGLITWSPYKRS